MLRGDRYVSFFSFSFSLFSLCLSLSPIYCTWIYWNARFLRSRALLAVEPDRLRQTWKREREYASWTRRDIENWKQYQKWEMRKGKRSWENTYEIREENWYYLRASVAESFFFLIKVLLVQNLIILRRDVCICKINCRQIQFYMKFKVACVTFAHTAGRFRDKLYLLILR